MAKADLKKLFHGKETKGEELKEAKAIKSGKISPKQYAMGEKMEEKKMKKGGMMGGGMMGGYKDGGMTMVKKDGKMVPDFAADGKGKMKNGGEAKKAPVYGRAMMRVTADTKGRALGKGK
jgi:hypothetical protein